MSKYEKHIFLLICEESLISFENSSFMTYVSYCKNMGECLKSGNLTNQQHNSILVIIGELDRVFSMDSEDTAKYIVDFFSLDTKMIYEYEKSVKLTQAAFPKLV